MEQSLMCQLHDPELKRLATAMPHRVIQSRAAKTADRYSRAFNAFHVWTMRYDALTSLPSRATTVALYLGYLMLDNSPYSKLESAVNGIRWVHGVYGLNSPCESTLVRNMLEAGKRNLSKPIQKKEPLTLRMLEDLCVRYAGAARI